jgi:type II secretory pathway pseudopilin PulG
MMRPFRSQSEAASAPREGEAGFLLMAAVVMVALVLIALAVAAPVVARDLRRDKEVESAHRAKEYVRAIRLYQRKFKNQYPPSIEALEKSNNVRYLRKQYVDPLTGKADWRIIHVGENKTSVKGFFGEPLGGLDTKGGGGGLGSASSMASTPTGGGISGLAGGFAPDPGKTTTGTGGSTTAGSTSGGGIGTPVTPSSGFGSGSVGPIMGVGSSRTGTSILEPNEQTTYETWEFLYDPRIELMYAKGKLSGGGMGSQGVSGFGKDATSPTTPANPTGGTPGSKTP